MSKLFEHLHKMEVRTFLHLDFERNITQHEFVAGSCLVAQKNKQFVTKIAIDPLIIAARNKWQRLM